VPTLRGGFGVRPPSVNREHLVAATFLVLAVAFAAALGLVVLVAGLLSLYEAVGAGFTMLILLGIAVVILAAVRFALFLIDKDVL
jgi:hypothetical protein